MKKVISITLGGTVFAIEQDAFAVLQEYFKSIEVHLASDEDLSEVMNDIELAVAEKFTTRNRNEKQAVTENDVKLVVAEMGDPSDYGDGEDDSESPVTGGIKKRLYRDEEEKVLGGVASGLAQYFDIDTVIVRLIFVIATFFNGLGILAYIILWLVVPAAKTKTERFAMRGEKVNLSHLSEQFKKKINEIESSSSEARKGIWHGIRSFFAGIFTIIGVLVRVLKKVLRYVIGFALLLTGSLGLAGLVSMYTIVLFSEKTFLPLDAQTALEIMTTNTAGIIAITSSFIMAAIPLLVLVLAGGSAIAKRSLFTTSKSITLAVVWIIAITLAATTSALQVEKVMTAVGPIEGQFHNSEFEVRFEQGVLYGNDNSVWFENDDDLSNAPTSTETDPEVLPTID